MKHNTIELKILESSPIRIQTTVSTLDGISHMEIHRYGLNETEVLLKLNKNSYHRSAKGDWSIVLVDDQQVFNDANFGTLISKAIGYIHERDFPDQFDYGL